MGPDALAHGRGASRDALFDAEALAERLPHHAHLAEPTPVRDTSFLTGQTSFLDGGVTAG
jgi:hypothetical protein